MAQEETFLARVNKNHSVRIPPVVRDKLAILPGTRVAITIEKDDPYIMDAAELNRLAAKGTTGQKP